MHCQEKDPKYLKIVKKEMIKICWSTTVSLRAFITISNNLPLILNWIFEIIPCAKRNIRRRIEFVNEKEERIKVSGFTVIR